MCVKITGRSIVGELVKCEMYIFRCVSFTIRISFNAIVKREKKERKTIPGICVIVRRIFLVYRPGYGQCSTNVTRLASHDSRYKRANILNTGGIHVLRWITSEHKKDFSERKSGCTDPMMHFDPLLTCVARIRKVKRFKSCSLVLFVNRFDEPLFVIFINFSTTIYIDIHTFYTRA